MIEKETIVAEPFIELDSNNLIIQHEAENANAMYDICSIEGRILITGKFNGPNMKIDLEGYPQGGYNIFILDGEQVFRNSFNI